MKISTLFFIAAFFGGHAFANETSTNEPTKITIQKFAFAPKEITVAPGTKVTWVNKDETPHALGTTDKSFASKAIDTDDTYEYTFVKEGDFSYFCTLHPFMTGVIHVHAGK